MDDVALSPRIWTTPNVLSMLRLAGVPVFLYWTLETHQDGRAILLLMAAGRYAELLRGHLGTLDGAP